MRLENTERTLDASGRGTSVSALYSKMEAIMRAPVAGHKFQGQSQKG